LAIKKPLITCILPVFNGERYLSEALDSILAQTYRPLEVIVVDDGSTDNTARIIRGYGNKIRYLRQHNTGPAAARNRGLIEAQGEFISFLDQDDLWHKEKLTRQMSHFEIYHELEVCIGHVLCFWVPELYEEEAKFKDHRLTRPVPGYLTGTLLTRRSVFRKVGQFNTSLLFGDALDWFLRAAEEQTAMELLPDVLMYHRIHKTNFSRNQSSASRDEFVRILKLSLDRRRSTNAEMTIYPYEFPETDWRQKINSD
jgi:glycosyltransferase involved in cell wall biosynthesis